MLKGYRFAKGQGTLEYVVVLMFVLGAFLIFQKYVVRGFSGRWKAVGDSFGEGQIYDPNLTVECAVDTRYPNDWYDTKCFKQNCQTLCFGVNYAADPAACQTCITVTCANTLCDDPP